MHPRQHRSDSTAVPQGKGATAIPRYATSDDAVGMDASDTTDRTRFRPLREIAYDLPGGRGQVSPRTIIRWLTSGVRVGGTVHRLKGERVGGEWRTCERWLDEFLAALTAAARGGREDGTAATDGGGHRDAASGGEVGESEADATA